MNLMTIKAWIRGLQKMENPDTAGRPTTMRILEIYVCAPCFELYIGYGKVCLAVGVARCHWHVNRRAAYRIEEVNDE